jgi:hypothetical protein
VVKSRQNKSTDHKAEIIMHKGPILNYIFVLFAFICFLIQTVSVSMKIYPHEPKISLQCSSTVNISQLTFIVFQKYFCEMCNFIHYLKLLGVISIA